MKLKKNWKCSLVRLVYVLARSGFNLINFPFGLLSTSEHIISYAQESYLSSVSTSLLFVEY